MWIMNSYQLSSNAQRGYNHPTQTFPSFTLWYVVLFISNQVSGFNISYIHSFILCVDPSLIFTPVCRVDSVNLSFCPRLVWARGRTSSRVTRQVWRVCPSHLTSHSPADVRWPRFRFQAVGAQWPDAELRLCLWEVLRRKAGSGRCSVEHQDRPPSWLLHVRVGGSTPSLFASKWSLSP